jgi:subtilisin family serine protease
LYPAAFDLDNVISVAASQPDDSLVSWSCYGPGSVDIAAPGVGIVSTWPTYLYPTGYWSMDGTSMASPHVAGVAALILSRVPGATYPFLRHALLSSAAPVPSLAGKVASGGRLDASAALSTATAGNALSPRAPIPSLHGGSTVAATWANVDLWWSASGPARISSFELQRSTDGGTSFVPLTLNPATATEWRQRVTVDGPPYAFRVRATDVRSSVSAWATEPPFRLRYVQESSPTIAYQGSWSSSSMSGALGASVRSASASAATATISLAVGTQAFGVVFARSPGSGKAEIWVDGSRRATLDLYRGTVQARWLGFGASLEAGTTHTVVVKVLGQKRKAASGTTVSFDATATLASQ